MKRWVRNQAGSHELVDLQPAGNYVVGPAGATDRAAARFDGATGLLVRDSALLIADTTAALSRSGNGGIPLQGTNTNDDAASGFLGEYFESVVPIGSSVSISTVTATNLTSLPNLPAGDYQVFCQINYVPDPTSNVLFVQASISTTSNTRDTAPGNLTTFGMAAAGEVGAPAYSVQAFRRLKLAAPTTVYAVGFEGHSVSTMTMFGNIWARRAR